MSEESGTAWIAGGACAIAAALAFSACSADATTVCPAIGWSSALVVTLADDWPPVDGGSLTVDCAPRCGWAVAQSRGAARADGASARSAR